MIKIYLPNPSVTLFNSHVSGFFQMSERTELSSMVTLKEQHIQDLEREKGELLRKLMPGAGSQV
jgi:hypothetical protein